MLKKFTSPYLGVYKIIKLYWSIYGGWCALIFSPYFHFSIVFTLLMSNFWKYEAWWDVSIAVLPSIIGFALGGYAIWLGFGDEKFRHLISESDDDLSYSPYLIVSATFAHFITVQLTALCFAILAKAMNFHVSEIDWFFKLLLELNIPPRGISEILAPILYGFGFLFFMYAIMTALAATFAVFRVATWFDKYRNSAISKDGSS